MVKDKIIIVYFLFLIYKFVNRDNYIATFATRLAEAPLSNQTYYGILTKGKSSYLIIHEIKRYLEGSRIFSMLSSSIDFLRLRTTDAEVECFCVKLSDKLKIRTALLNIDKNEVQKIRENPVMISLKRVVERPNG